MPRIFISYRRDDSAGHTGRIFDRLSDHFGQDSIFMDVDTISPGRDFVDAVRQAVGSCDRLVAVIGREWLSISDTPGSRRLDDPDDLVRLEVATALERGIRVVPVLVQGARMPGAADLPDALKVLATRNALEVSDRRFHSDVQRLIEALRTVDPEPSETGEFAVQGRPGTSGFVGREQEMGELRAALEDAMSGRGRLMMLAGEPGIGKTRMTQELASYAEQQGAQVLWGWCYEEEGAPPYWPWAQPIRTYLHRCDAERLRSDMGPGASDIAEVISEVGDKLPGLPPSPPLAPEQARFRLFGSITTFLRNAAQSRPMVLVLEDLHWADRSSLLLLEFLAKEMGKSRLLVIGTFRDAELTARHQLSQALGNLVREQHFRRIQLGGLTQQEVAQYVEANSGVMIQGGAAELVHRRTEGNPLFVGEIVRLLRPAEMTEDQAWAETIPEGVRDVIGRRLSRLSEPCVQALRTASVIGRNFEFKLLNALISDISEDGLLEAIDEAQAAHIIDEMPEEIEHYRFSHALIQETLFQDLSVSRRVRMHARIGESLEAYYGDNPREHAAELAHHFFEAAPVSGSDKLVRYSQLAGEQALAAYAREEALFHFQRGLSAKDIGAPQELALQTLLGQVSVQLWGYSAPQVQQAFGRARELIGKIGVSPEYFQLMYGLCIYYMGRSEFQPAQEVAEQYLKAAQNSQDPISLLIAHRCVGIDLLFRGEAIPAQDHLKQGFALYDIQQHRSLARTYGQEPMVTGLGWYATNQWILGYPDQASAHIQEALTLAQEIAHPFTLAFAEHHAAWHHIWSRSIDSALGHTESSVHLAKEQGFVFRIAFAKLLQGACWAQMGRAQEGITILTEGLAAMAATGATLHKSNHLSWLAEANLIAGESKDGLKALDEAFAHVNETGERFWEAELYRIKGVLLLLPGGSEAEAEDCFKQALEVAKGQSAKSLELRAAMSMARLWRKQSKSAEALELLSGIYGWFTEGFDTPDLIDAKALLEELS